MGNGVSFLILSKIIPIFPSEGLGGLGEGKNVHTDTSSVLEYSGMCTCICCSSERRWVDPEANP